MDNSIKLKAGISKYYKKGFILDEESLRRIQGVLESAAKELATETVIVFKVNREDDRFYETFNIEDVLSDSNIRNRRITDLEIRLTNKNQSPNTEPWRNDWIVSILFSIESKFENYITDRNEVSFKISGEDKNWSLLLSDKLEPQIHRTFKAKSTSRWLIFMFIIPLFFISFKLFHFKLDDLYSSFLVLGPILLVSFFIFIDQRSSISKNIANLIGPESAFLWGDEQSEYLNRENFRKNFKWVVLVGFLVSFIASGIWLFII